MKPQSRFTQQRLRSIGLGITSLALGLTLSLGMTPTATYAASQPPAPVMPGTGGPNTRFSFSAGGFIGDLDTGADDDTNDAEIVAFWINQPDGRTVRAIRAGVDNDYSPNASAVRANRDGSVAWEWSAEGDALRGDYTMVAYGTESKRSIVIPFRIDGNSSGAPLNGTATVTPAAATAGSTFTFTIRGFVGDPDDGEDDKTNNAEEVVFWINLPDGRTIEAIRATADDDDENANRERASRAGEVTLTWEAPASLPAGDYTLVAHGLTSEREQIVPFTIR